ncbi:hypothetical protein BVX95_01975 [archaeon D22]|nr:hypothetical protein BVX95_01975 [archaeon D22]
MYDKMHKNEKTEFELLNEPVEDFQFEENCKVVYDDEGTTKVIRGVKIAEDDFTYTLIGDKTNQKITIGKRVITQIIYLD